MPLIGTLLADELRLLTFRPVSSSIHNRWKPYLAFGFLATWLAGIGRYWDNPRAEIWQKLGLGSVVYVFVLAAILWLLTAPLRPRNWTYRNVLLFVTLTAPPAFLYAIPVEMFLSPEDARTANAWLLAVVAAWRVALYAVFLRRTAALKPLVTLVATLLPLAIIVVALALLNLEHVVFNLMGGIRPEQQGSHDAAYEVVLRLAFLSFHLAPFLLLAYVVMVGLAWRRKE